MIAVAEIRDEQHVREELRLEREAELLAHELRDVAPQLVTGRRLLSVGDESVHQAVQLHGVVPFRAGRERGLDAHAAAVYGAALFEALRDEPLDRTLAG